MPEERTVRLPVEPESVDRVWQWLEAWTVRLGMEESLVQAMRLSAEEVATNIVRHAFVDAAVQPMFQVTLGIDEALTLTFEDEGVAFDPTAYSDRADTTTLEDVAVGGVGIRLIRGSVEDFRYERVGGINRLVLCFGPSPLGPARSRAARS